MRKHIFDTKTQNCICICEAVSWRKSLFFVLCSWFMVLGSWFLVLGSWFYDLCSLFFVLWSLIIVLWSLFFSNCSSFFVLLSLFSVLCSFLVSKLGDKRTIVSLFAEKLTWFINTPLLVFSILGRCVALLINKTRYTATPFACGWAGAVEKVTKVFKRGNELKSPKAPTDQPTNWWTKWGIELRSKQLKKMR